MVGGYSYDFNADVTLNVSCVNAVPSLMLWLMKKWFPSLVKCAMGLILFEL